MFLRHIHLSIKDFYVEKRIAIEICLASNNRIFYKMADENENKVTNTFIEYIIVILLGDKILLFLEMATVCL